VPVRQWVLLLPISLRLLLAAQPKLVTPVLQVVHRVITRFLLGQAGLKADEAESRSVTLIQRFGSAANLNIHLHCLVLDGVYRRGIDGTPEFVEVPEPTDEALQSVLHKIITRMMKLLTRQGVLVEEEGSTYMADNDGDSDEARVLRPLQAAACTYRIAFGPRAGQKVLTVQGAERGHGTAPAGGPLPREGLALASASAACKPCRGRPSSSNRCAPISTVSACTQPCAAAPMTARRLNNCAATAALQAALRHGPLESAASESLRTDDSVLVARDNLRNAPKKDNFRLRR
jgi:hypothetical protein